MHCSTERPRVSLLDAPRVLSRAIILQPGRWVLGRVRRLALEPLARAAVEAHGLDCADLRQGTTEQVAPEIASGKARAERARAEADAYLRQHLDRLEADLASR